MIKSYWMNWLKAAGMRALKTVAQTAVATIGTAVAFHDVSWGTVVSAALLAGVLSLLTSLAGLPEVEPVKDSGDPDLYDVTDVTDYKNHD